MPLAPPETHHAKQHTPLVHAPAIHTSSKGSAPAPRPCEDGGCAISLRQRFAYVGVAAYALWRGPAPAVDVLEYTMVDVGSNGWRWFQHAKPYCNTLEVETVHRRNPPPNDLEGAGFSAACYALAANLAESRSIIMGLEPGDRWKAAGIVFDIGHPVADMGDDRSAGPIMEMVVEFWPNHYQALYHAGASNYALGQDERARRYLEDFLSLYDVDDGFSLDGMAALRRLHAATLQESPAREFLGDLVDAIDESSRAHAEALGEIEALLAEDAHA